jgi:hypothetical protein
VAAHGGGRQAACSVQALPVSTPQGALTERQVCVWGGGWLGGGGRWKSVVPDDGGRQASNPQCTSPTCQLSSRCVRGRPASTLLCGYHVCHYRLWSDTPGPYS